MIDYLNAFIAFNAGLLSFFSPCVVVLVPIFLANIAGVRIDQADQTDQAKKVIHATWLFVLGFSITFTVFGLLSAIAAIKFISFERNFSIIAGIFLIIFGLIIAEIINAPLLQRTLKIQIPLNQSKNKLYPLLMGVSFAAGWTPCVGPVLAAILLLAGQSGSVTTGALYLLFYSIGLTLPFLFFGYSIGRSRKILERLIPQLVKIKYLTATVVIALGVLLITGKLGMILSYFYFINN